MGQMSKHPAPVTVPDGFKITKLPDGEAIGARDLQNWGAQRAAGRIGVRDNRKNVFTVTIACKCGHNNELLVHKSQLARVDFKCAKCGAPISHKVRRRDRERIEPPRKLMSAKTAIRRLFETGPDWAVVLPNGTIAASGLTNKMAWDFIDRGRYRGATVVLMEGQK
jgi:hypothetical protein